MSKRASLSDRRTLIVHHRSVCWDDDKQWYQPTNRWGYLMATIYGSQNGVGQFHTNCYSEAKLRAICKRMHLNFVPIERFQWKGDRDHMLGLTATKS